MGGVPTDSVVDLCGRPSAHKERPLDVHETCTLRVESTVFQVSFANISKETVGCPWGAYNAVGHCQSADTEYKTSQHFVLCQYQCTNELFCGFRGLTQDWCLIPLNVPETCTLRIGLLCGALRKHGTPKATPLAKRAARRDSPRLSCRFEYEPSKRGRMPRRGGARAGANGLARALARQPVTEPHRSEEQDAQGPVDGGVAGNGQDSARGGTGGAQDAATDGQYIGGLAMDVTTSHEPTGQGTGAGGGATAKRKPAKERERATAAEATAAYCALLDLIQPTCSDPTDAGFEAAMQECADKLIKTFVHLPFMVDTGIAFQEDPDASARAAQDGSNAVRGYQWVVTSGPNIHYRPGPNQHGLPTNPVRGAKPPWHDLTLQMAVTHAGITKATTNMKEAAPLNTMPDASTFGTKGNNHRTRWWVYTVAAMAACDALGKVRGGSCVACALYH